jgi:predicted transcriptional regulator
VGRKPKTNGYIVRQELNQIDRAVAELNRFLERLLACESERESATLIAQAAIVANKISKANRALKDVLLSGKGNSDE